MISDDQPIIIVGAGLGGMTAALALLRQGVPTRVYEQAPELGEVGAGITMWPNATRALESLGLREVMEQRGFVPEDMGTRHYRTGELLNHIIVGANGRERYGAPQYFMHRADLHEILTDAVRALDPDALLLNHTLENVSQDDSGVTAYFANGATVRGAAIIGCDGIHSVVRRSLFGLDKPQWMGIVAWRGMAPMKSLPQEVLTPTSCTWQGPDHYFVRYPVRGRTMMNYVAFASGTVEWAEESWKLRSTVEEVLEQFAGWEPRVQTVIKATPPDASFKWALHDREPLDCWTRGRITLLGDAAHAALPFLGQGAAMAIEDGVVLARCLAAEDNVPRALQRYEAARKERTHWVQVVSRLNSRRNFRNPDTQQTGELAKIKQEEADFRRYDASTVTI